jgi:FkbM family methyltransferase
VEKLLRRLASLLPYRVAHWLSELQFRSAWAAKAYAVLAGRVARGETVLTRGAGKDLRIDATGTAAGYAVGMSNPDEQQWLVDTLERGAAFYDVGANIGFFALIAARLVGEHGVVVAFEPLPENVEQLRRNVALNALPIEVVPAAVTCMDGSVRFGSADGARNLARIDRGPLRVPAIKLDGWVQDHGPPPDVVKIDVEGAEIDVLCGAAETLRAYRPEMLIEVHWLGHEFTRYVEEVLRPLGYTCELLGGGAVPDEPVRCHVVLSTR